MPLTPADVHNVAFSKPPIGKRGYNEDEVDAFLDLVEAELGRLLEENNDLREQVEQLEQQLSTAHADLDDARSKAEQLLSEARTKSDSMVNEARTRAETMLNDARTRAETLERQARDKASTLERDAQRKHNETISLIEQQKGGLEKKIDELRTF